MQSITFPPEMQPLTGLTLGWTERNDATSDKNKRIHKLGKEKSKMGVTQIDFHSLAFSGRST